MAATAMTVRALVATATGVALALPVTAANAAPSDKWSTITTFAIAEDNRPSLTPSGSGVAVVWTRAERSPASLMRRTYSSTGTAGATQTILAPSAGWETLAPDPVALGSNVAISGVRTAPGTPQDWPGAALLVGPTGGFLGQLSASETAYSGDLAAATVGGVPVTVFGDVTSIDTSPLSLHVGTSPGQDVPVAPVLGCCAHRPAVVAGPAGSAWVAWYSTQAGTPDGWVARQVLGLPSEPTPWISFPAPGGTGSAGLPTQRAALAARAGGDAWLAYPLHSSGSRKIRVWQVGTSTYRDIRTGAPAEQVSLAADSAGRLWLAYVRPGKKDVSVVRSDSAVSTFSEPDTRSIPGGEAFSTALDATSGRRADLVINTGEELRLAQFLPRLSAAARVIGRSGRTARIKVAVRDGKSPVRGAVVTAGSARAKTGASGRVRVQVTQRGKVRIDVTKKNYLPARLRLPLR